MKRIKKLTTITTLFVFVCSTITATIPLPASAANDACTIPAKENPNICLDEFFQGNDIIYYDPNAVDCTAAPVAIGADQDQGALIGNSNAEKIFTYLVGKGLTAEQAAGVLGNFQQESGFNPAIREGGAIAGPSFNPIDGEGFGIAQWTFDDRQIPLENMARDTGRPVIDLSLQLDYLWFELTGRWASSLASLKAENSPERAAYIFHRDYEGSDDSAEFVMRVRGGNARIIYEQFKDLAPSSTTDTETASPDNCTPTSQGSGGALTNFMNDDFTIYNQCQFPPYGGSWGLRTAESATRGTICAEGCIPTSLAMIAKNLTGDNITPNNTIDAYNATGLWNANGPGSMTTSPLNAAKDFNMRVETISDKGNVAAYKEVFDNGGLIMAISTGSSPFLAGRHAIVIRGITNDGRFMIADPGRTENNTAPANKPTVEKILTDIRGDGMSVSYAFYKQ